MHLDKQEITEIIKNIYTRINTEDIADWTEYKQGFTEALFRVGIEVRDAIEEKTEGENKFKF